MGKSTTIIWRLAEHKYIKNTLKESSNPELFMCFCSEFFWEASPLLYLLFFKSNLGVQTSA